MKRFFGLLTVLLLFNGCDDGNLQVESFDFSTVQASACNGGISDNQNNFFVYKIKGNEAIILQVPITNFPNIETESGSPRSIPISSGSAAKIIYRLYSGPVQAATLCSSIPSSTPSVAEEWNAIGGTIEITTNIVNPINPATGANKITSYSHNIVFRNVTFDIGGGKTQTNDLIVFGNYNTPAIVPADVTTLPMRECNSVLFKISGPQLTGLYLDEAARNTLFINEETLTPRVLLLNETNHAKYLVYPTTVSEEAFCANELPTAVQTWNSQPAVEGVSGFIEVTTVFTPPNYEHTITFRNVIFKNDNIRPTFTFGTNYVFGVYTTTP